MAYEKKHGDLVLFPNTNKQGKQPDWRGEIFLNGQTFEVACWNKVSKAGNRFVNGFVGKPKEEKKQDSGGWSNKTASKHSTDSNAAFDDDLPWK